MRWNFVWLLYNLELEKPFDTEYLAIAPNADRRVHLVMHKAPATRALVRAFKDEFGRKRHPSVVLMRDDAPAAVGKWDTIRAFRNIFAVSCLINGWQEMFASSNVTHSLFSETFDIYPLFPSTDEKGFITRSPAVTGFDSVGKFRGQTSPELPLPSQMKAAPDDAILKQLMTVWDSTFVQGKPAGWEVTRLFRSLEMAYHAMKLPTETGPSIYDFGSRISLWVSSFEILAHPEKKKANLGVVLDLLSQYSWSNPELVKRPYQLRVRDKQIAANLAQQLYSELYYARNDFLHGNPVNSDRLYAFKNQKRPFLTSLAPLLYKVALAASLGDHGYRPKKSSLAEAGIRFREALARKWFEEALLSALSDNRR